MIFVVKYLHISQRGTKAPLPKDRETIWLQSGSGRKLKDMDVYQPEVDGYFVVEVIITAIHLVLVYTLQRVFRLTQNLIF